MNNNRFLKILCLGVFIVHMLIVNAGVFSFATGQTGTGVSTGSYGIVCSVVFEGKTDCVSDGSESVLCAECNWVTWELGTDGEYREIENESSMCFEERLCKKGKKGDSCTSSKIVGFECPEDQPKPSDTGTE